MDPATLLPLILLVVAFYFLIIRPARRRQQDQRDTINRLEPGRRVMTASGMLGTVTEVTDEHVELEVAEGVRVRFVPQAVSKVLPEPAADTADTADADETADTADTADTDGAPDPLAHVREDAAVDLSEPSAADIPPLPGRSDSDTPPR